MFQDEENINLKNKSKLGYNEYDNNNFNINEDNPQVKNSNIKLNNKKEQDEEEDFQLKELYNCKGNIRMGFIKKVYAILCTQLLFTVINVVLSIYVIPYKNFLDNNRYIGVISIVVNWICFYSLSCYKDVSRNVPTNYIVLGIFTFTESMIISYLTIPLDHQVILIASILTFSMFIGLTVYAFFTRTDFSIKIGMLFIAGMTLSTATILSVFFYNKIVSVILSFFIIILFGFYILFDTQLILGDKEKSYLIDDYIFASMNLYIDITQIFVHLLMIFGDTN